MTGVDWIIVGLLLLLALFGWAQGFVTGALALIGFALGAWLGTRLAGLVLSDGSRNPWAPAIGLVGALCLGAALAAGFEGLGFRLRSKLTMPGIALRRRDPRRAADRLRRARRRVDPRRGRGPLQRRGPLRGPALADPHAAQQGAAAVGAAAQRARALRPVPAHRRPGGARRRRRAKGIAPRPAGRRRRPAAWSRSSGPRAGSGSRARAGWRTTASWSPTPTSWPARTTRTCCCAARAAGYDATAIAFDPRNDVAVLRVDGLDAPALPIADSPDPGTSAAILGFPLNGPYDVRAGRLGQTRTSVTQDAYGRGPVQRRHRPRCAASSAPATPAGRWWTAAGAW